MRLRPLLAAFCVLLTISASTAPLALAQVGMSDLEKALEQQPGGAVAPTSPSDDSPIPEGITPTTPPASTTAAPAGAAVPAPPPYLSPGQSAAVQPISAVANLTEPDLPLEPVRIAAMIAALLAVLLVGAATLLRSLGLRTSVVTPVAVAPSARFSRVRERTGLLADDVRDFLRHDR